MNQPYLHLNLELSEVHLDALKEISNIGMGHAATALSQMIGKRIELSIPEVMVSPLSEFSDLLGSSEQIVVGIFIKIWGDVQGNILLVMPWDSVRAVCHLLCGGPEAKDFVLTELQFSALREVGNILVSSYLGALERLLGKALLPSVPSVAFDMAGAVLESALIQMGEVSDHTLVIKAAFIGVKEGIHGDFFLIPDPASLRVILQAARVLAEEKK